MAHHAPPDFAQFFAIRQIQVPPDPASATFAFSADSASLFYSTDTSGQFNLWRVPVTGGCPVQLTAFEDLVVRTVAPSPDGSVIAFTADRDGSEQYQIFGVDPAGGWPQPWTDALAVQHRLGNAAWDARGAQLAYSANARTPAAQDVWVRDQATGQVRHVFGDDQTAVPVSFSPDGKQLLCLEFRGNTDQRLHLVDLTSDTSRALIASDAPARFSPGPWAADGSGFWVRTDLGREFVGLAFFDLAAEKLEWSQTPHWDVSELAGDPGGRVLLWAVNEDGWTTLRGRDLRTGEPLPPPQLPAGCGSIWGTGLTVSPDGRYAAVAWRTPRRCAELYVWELATGDCRRLTDNMLGGLDPQRLVAPALIRYPSVDELQIPAWVYRPEATGRVPVVLSIHGGPEAQELPAYSPLYQYLLSRGVAVMATNIRGSTGYGRSYQKLIHRDFGGKDLEDFRHAVQWLTAQDWVDPARLGVMGGSYGGFATLSCVSRLPQYWAVAVDICGPANLVTFASSVPPTWRRMMADWVGDPQTEADFLTARSPLTYVDQIRAPLLVIQGAQDPRVVKAESDQMVARLTELGRRVEYVVFDDEGHGFTRRKNMQRVYRLSADWLLRHLTSPTPPS